MGNLANIFNYKTTSNTTYDFNTLSREPKNNSQTNAKKPNRVTYEELPNILKALPVFNKLSNSDVLQLIKCMKKKFYSKNDVIIKQGDMGNTFYFILFGKVNVMIKSGNNKPYKQVATLKSGDSFGETSLLTGNPRNATIIAAENGIELLVLDKFTFLAVTNRQKDTDEEKISNFNKINNTIEGAISPKLKDKRLKSILIEYNLQKYETLLINELGVETLNDLEYLDQNDYLSIGCKTVQIRKFNQIVRKYIKKEGQKTESKHQRYHTAYI